MIETVGHLRELGFLIEMDDFGSGYSSLNMLNKMPVDILKLDMKFIQSMTAKPSDCGILHFIMELARWMNLKVVAEGVETKEQLERLREAGCDYVQGYYFARPMPVGDFETLLMAGGMTTSQKERMKDGSQSEYTKPFLLVADEDAGYRSEVRRTFEGCFRVEEAADGRTALECIADNGTRMAAVILSLTLTGAEGFTVLEVLQREKKVWNMAVIATGPQNEQLEDKALEMGADDFAGHPHSQRGLKKRVLQAIALKVSRERIICPDLLRTGFGGSDK